MDIDLHSSINSLFDDVNHGNVEFGVVPIENSSQGSIKLTIDNLIKEDIKICGEVNLTIKHCLLSKNKILSRIKKIYAHEQTFLKCNEWLTKNMPNVQRIFCTSNSAAVKKIINMVDASAIASDTCSTLCKIPILKTNINDTVENTTRFIIDGAHEIESSGHAKTSIL